MKLIIEKWDGVVYVYRETDRHFRKVEKGRKTPRIKPEAFNEECGTHHYDDFHVVFDLKSEKRKAKAK